MGLPEDDWGHIHELAERNTSTQDPDLAGEDDYSGSIEMAMYAIEFAARRRAEPPREDLTTLILEADFAGSPDDRRRLRQLLRAAGHRGQRHDEDDAVVRPARVACSIPTNSPSCATDPSLMPGCGRRGSAVGQPAPLLPPHDDGRHRARRSRPVPAGDKVAMYYSSANRDEDGLRRLRRPSTSTATRIRTSPSGSPSTSVSAFTSHVSRGGSSSRSCSARSARSSSPVTRSGSART